MASYIWHVTLNTGGRRRSPRSEVDPVVARIVADNLAEALAGGVVPLPDDFGSCSLKATATGPWLLATVLHGDTPLVTIGVAPRSRGDWRLWQMLHDNHRLTTDPAELPPPPWCAVRIEAGLLRHLDATAWLGDYERLLAWAWVDRP